MFLNDNDPQWNDISCYSLLGGVICKRNCSADCPNEDNSTTTTSSSTTAVGLTTQTTEETTTEVQYDEATTEDIETSTPNSCGNNSNICGADGWKWKCFKNGKCYSYHKYSVKGSYWKVIRQILSLVLIIILRPLRNVASTTLPYAPLRLRRRMNMFVSIIVDVTERMFGLICTVW